MSLGMPSNIMECFSQQFPASMTEADGAVKGLDLLETITRNTAQNPKEDTWRSVHETHSLSFRYHFLVGPDGLSLVNAMRIATDEFQ